MQMKRSILHLDLDTFFVSVERLKEPRLKGKPVLVGGTGNRGMISSCSYEARRFGVHAAMPTRIARKLCPHGIFLKGDFDAYSEKSAEVSEIISEESPVYEKASVDEFYVDMTGMERFWGCRMWSKKIRARVYKETGLPISFGLSVNKLVAKVATNEAKPNGEKEVSAKEVLPFLAPMHVSKIPLVGKQLALNLAYMGVRKVRTLREIPLPLLTHAFGKHGDMLYKRARGEDDREVVPHTERKSISAEHTFSVDTIDIAQLRAFLISVTEKLSFNLRKSGKLTACVSVKIRYTDFETVSKQVKIPYTASDDLLIKKVLQLFEKLYTRRVRLRLVGVKFSQLVPGHHQITLFQSIPKQVDLYHALDQIRFRFGSDSVRLASGFYSASE
ncbi:MAG: DNA polymerase IV [Bacteroidota bacterium]